MAWPAEIEIRPAAEDDLEAEHEAFDEAQRELHERHGLAWSAMPVEWFLRVHGHLLRHDAERCYVASSNWRIVGFSAALVRGDFWFLSALFVRPRAQGLGVGRALLEHSWGHGPGRRATISEAIQPVSTGLYAGRGLIPTTPVLILAGAPRAAPSDLAPGDPDQSSLAALDQAAYGFDRSVDHVFWSQTSASSTLWLREGRPVAYSYVSPRGLIGPIAGADAHGAADALRAELSRRAGEKTFVAVPGSAASLVATALEAGLRLEHPGLLLLQPPTEPPRALAIASFWLL